MAKGTSTPTRVTADVAAVAAAVDAGIAGRTADERFGPAARITGQRTVSLDDDGLLIEIAPDGSRRRL